MGYTVYCKADVVRVEEGGFASWQEAKESALKLLAAKIADLSKIEAAIKRADSFAEYLPDDEVADEYADEWSPTATLLRHAVADEVTCWGELWTLWQDQLDAEEREVEAELAKADSSEAGVDLTANKDLTCEVDLGPSRDAGKNRDHDMIRDARQAEKKRAVK